jgi:hypothetical protein
MKCRGKAVTTHFVVVFDEVVVFQYPCLFLDTRKNFDFMEISYNVGLLLLDHHIPKIRIHYEIRIAASLLIDRDP